MPPARWGVCHAADRRAVDAAEGVHGARASTTAAGRLAAGPTRRGDDTPQNVFLCTSYDVCLRRPAGQWGCGNLGHLPAARSDHPPPHSCDESDACPTIDQSKEPCDAGVLPTIYLIYLSHHLGYCNKNIHQDLDTVNVALS